MCNVLHKPPHGTVNCDAIMAMSSELNITHVRCQARGMEARFYHSVFADCRNRNRLLHINVRMDPEPLVTDIVGSMHARRERQKPRISAVSEPPVSWWINIWLIMSKLFEEAESAREDRISTDCKIGFLGTLRAREYMGESCWIGGRWT